MANEHNHDDVRVQNKFWSPRLIELTSIGNPSVENGVPQKTFVDPTMIGLIFRGRGAWYMQDQENLGKQYPLVECTAVWLRGGGPQNINVLESPEEVALRRDRALEVPVQLVEAK